LKITYFINHYPKVSHSFIRREIQALERQGFDVQRIALRGWDDTLPDAQDQNERERTRYVLQLGPLALIFAALCAMCLTPLRFFQALRLAIKMSKDSDRPLPYHFIYVAEACRILPWMAHYGSRHVHAHFGTNSTEVVMLARVLGGPPYSFTVHGPDEFLRPMGLDVKIRRSDFAVAISAFGRSQLCLRSRYEDWPKIKVVHCGLERTFYDGAATQPAVTSRLVCVGRLCEAKGQLLLVEAAAGLATRGVSFELVLAGDGPMRPAIEALVDKHGLQSQVRITGWISSSAVRDEILAARALVLPSFAEGLPVVIMEAMALHRPVITTYIAGIPELVRHGVDGWLIPAGSVDDLMDAMQDCLSKPAGELQILGDAGYQRVLSRHAIDIEAGKLAVLFRATSMNS
jgi:colanic acid/amylovoran biosynthesis glycosyltransferase